MEADTGLEESGVFYHSSSLSPEDGSEDRLSTEAQDYTNFESDYDEDSIDIVNNQEDRLSPVAEELTPNNKALHFVFDKNASFSRDKETNCTANSSTVITSYQSKKFSIDNILGINQLPTAIDEDTRLGSNVSPPTHRSRSSNELSKSKSESEEGGNSSLTGKAYLYQ